jgi:phosphopantothenoylcysteine decarboxylase
MSGSAGTSVRPHILLGVTGSVATIKAAEVCRLLCEHGEVRLIATEAARHFLTEADLPPEVLPVLGVSIPILKP